MCESFDALALDLDKRLDKAVMKCGFVRPTSVQAKALPLALGGKDLLVRARTGSGKTLAFCLPLLNKILAGKDEEGAKEMVRAIVLAPTKELVTQIHAHMMELMYYCKDVVRAVALTNEKMAIQQAWLKSLPDVVISTPGRFAQHLQKIGADLKLRETVETFVVDEADLIFSFGYSDDVSTIVSHLPRTVQSLLMSATLNDDVLRLKKLVLHNPVVVKIEESVTDGKISQWYCKVNKGDADLLLFALLRLKLITGKTLFFVNSVFNAYRTKLLLEQFHIKSAVLNSKMPMNTRLHILQQFNRGVFDYLIATDEAVQYDTVASMEEEFVKKAKKQSDQEDVDNSEEENDDSDSNKGESADEMEDEEDEEDDEDNSDIEELKKKIREKSSDSKKRKRSEDQEGEEGDDDKVGYGVTRGIDFEDVATVININFPPTVASYTHRVGRTGRGGVSGTALSFVEEKNEEQEKLLAEIQKAQGQVDGKEQPALLALDTKEIDGFRYRVEDVRKAVTPAIIKKAQLEDLRKELLNSEKLKAHFEDNPTDMILLRHDTRSRSNRVNRSIATIPEYLLPSTLREKEGMLDQPKLHVKFADSTSNRLRWQKQKGVGKFRNTASKRARLANRKGRRRNKSLAGKEPFV